MTDRVSRNVKVLSIKWLNCFDSATFTFSADVNWNWVLKLSFSLVLLSLMHESKIIVPASLGGHPLLTHKKW